MALSLHQQLRQTQKLIMTPQMQQSIQLLQLNSMELEQMISEEMMENPFLELTDDEENLQSQNDDRDGQETGAETPAEDSGLSDQAKADSTPSDDGPAEREETVQPDQDRNDATPDELAGKEDREEFEKFEKNDVDWDNEFSDSDTSAYKSTREDSEESDFTTYTALNESLYDSLMRQARLSVLEGEEIDIAEFIIGNLDEDGFLDCSPENQAMILLYPPELFTTRPTSQTAERLRQMLRKLKGSEAAVYAVELKPRQLVAMVVGALLGITPDEAMTMSRREQAVALVARKLKKPADEVDEMRQEDLVLETLAWRLKTDPQSIYDVLEIVQDFEPTGIAARNLGECLRLQAEEQGIRNRVLYEVLENHLPDLQQKRFREIAKALDVSESRVQDVFHTISRLDPRPGRSTTKDTARYITPDVYVKKVDGRYLYFLNEGDAGRLRIASNYRRMASRNAREAAQNGSSNGHEAGQAQYANEKYKNAIWLIKNIEKRKSTVLRVTEAIMEYQMEFLEKGIEHLRPLTLRNIAEVVGMHESTIARVTTKKYVETPRGIFELKFFFSSGLETDSGSDASSRSIKEMITQMIEGENSRKPLSDQKIADMLKEKGVQIARRTVAKYREQLKILPAKLRKEVN